jgi:hypothetical protein
VHKGAASVFRRFDRGFVPCIPEPFDQVVEVVDDESRMRLLRGDEVRIDAEVDLDAVALEPGAAALGEFRRLRNFRDSENAFLEGARQRFAACRHRELDMVDRDERHIGSPVSKLFGKG